MSGEAPRVTRVREVPPDPSIANAVGRHHTFETAIADLIDNSIDAGAGHVLVRLLEQDGAVIGLRVVDDGKGMDESAIDSAMKFARKRDYDSSDLGHFGLGLKAASLSQADELRVYSRSYGVAPAGRMIRASAPTSVGELDTDDVASVLDTLHLGFALTSGTVIEWAEPRTFLSSSDTRDRTRWIEERITGLQSHLGIVFHRLITRGVLDITIDVFDLGYDEAGVPRRVEPVDPFGYDALPNDPWPKPLTIALDSSTARGHAHIWPASQSGRREFRLSGRPGTLAQGFYFYRRDRLLQIGGWNTLVVPKPELEYARLSLDLDDALAQHVTINPEKAGLELDSDLKSAIRAASVGNDLDFPSYLELAQGIRQESRRYTKRPIALVEPDRGFGADMLDAFAASVEFADADPIDIRWRVDRSESPLSVDIERRTVWLNEEYRDVIARPGSMDADDAPLVKTLLMIVFSKYFEGSYLGSREKGEIEAWEQLLTAALREELAQQARKMGDADE
jgi:hypothetical protein